VRAERRLLHWSNIVGASHSRSYMIWQYGDYASRGVREVCEFGYPRSVQDEIEQNVSSTGGAENAGRENDGLNDSRLNQKNSKNARSDVIKQKQQTAKASYR